MCISAGCRFPRAEQEPRSDESRRAENAYRKAACKQRTKADRLKIAAVLLDVIERHGISNGRLALMVDVNEKPIRKMLSADVSIPAHMAMRMPTDMRWEFLDGVAAASGCEPMGSTKRVLDRIRNARDLDAAHDLEDKARELSREIGRGR